LIYNNAAQLRLYVKRDSIKHFCQKKLNYIFWVVFYKIMLVYF